MKYFADILQYYAILVIKEQFMNDFERIIVSSESLLNCKITIHDWTGIFCNEFGQSFLLNKRKSHRKFNCCEKDFNRKCLNHCSIDIQKQLLKYQKPFVHNCWNGFQEFVVPIKRKNILLGALFAGIWSTEKMQKNEFDDPYPEKNAADLIPVLCAIADGLISKLEQLTVEEQSDKNNRKNQIYEFIKYHAAEHITLKDLADELYLSQSRTSHLVKELTRMSFQNLIKLERLNRAKNLLKTTSDPIYIIAENIGIKDEFHFNRLFKKEFGIPPGKFRKEEH